MISGGGRVKRVMFILSRKKQGSFCTIYDSNRGGICTLARKMHTVKNYF